MFKLFNGENKPVTSDKVFIHTKSKWVYCQKILTENPSTVFIGWFDDTIDELADHFSQSGIRASVLKARTINKAQIEDSQIIFIEHHPMKDKEDQLLHQLNLKKAVFLVALDEPFLKFFGGEKLVKLMAGMGMKEEEPIEHKLISQSIAVAQEKIESKVSFEQSTRSQAEWMERNLKLF
jgi:hypothetical protein